jgi:hypothetical protein
MTTRKTMTAKDYRKACATLNLSITASAKKLFISLPQAQRYAAGTHAVSERTAALLRAMIKLETTDI